MAASFDGTDRSDRAPGPACPGAGLAAAEKRGDRGCPRVALVALGCRVSRADKDALAAEIGRRSAIASRGEPADVVVVVTCAITADAEAAGRRAIRRAVRDHPGARIVATGCSAALRPDALAELPGVAAVVPPGEQGAIPLLVRALAEGGAPGEALARSAGGGGTFALAAASPSRHTRPFVKVQDGCDSRCAYCVVPLARGPSRSLPFDDALRRLALAGERHAEVVVTGVHLGAYGRDLAPRRSLAELVGEALRRGLARRVRLSSVEPNELPRDILAAPGASALCEHFHLPLQSGSARLLRTMGRPYAPEGFRRTVEEVAALVPGACIGTDVMVGFPGELEADHRATVALAEALPLSYLHVFPFSPRPGTAAWSLPGRVPPQVARERLREILALSDRKWGAYLAAQVGRELEVVVERVEGGVARGTAREYATVRWPSAGERRGALSRVRVEGSDGTECIGAPGRQLAERARSA